MTIKDLLQQLTPAQQRYWVLAGYSLGAITMHPAIEHVLKFFTYDHLPDRLQAAAKPFADLARQLAEAAPDNQETTVALRKLLEAKDAAVRSVLPTKPAREESEVAKAAQRGFNVSKG